MAVSRLIPAGPSRTVRVFDTFSSVGASAENMQARSEFAARVFAEDQAVIKTVQRGLRSGAVAAATVLPESEKLIKHFQDLVRAQLSDDLE
ncbi:MAG: SRPBCC family protein [Acidimicrobiales bacterium]